MGIRYLVSEVQLGMLIALNKQEERLQLVNNIIDIQYVKLPKKSIMDNCILINKKENQLKMNKFK